ncbi:hypothetical protein GN156_15150 [bacterium LRH843]|nr:hypothetical protein [bacterium LRH843]
MLKKISLILSLILLSIGVLGCQQIGGTENNNDGNYDIAGIVIEVNSENEGVLLDLTEKGNETAEQMWVFSNENTKISNENGETVRFENLKPKIKLKANLSTCNQPAIPECSAKEIVIFN